MSPQEKINDRACLMSTQIELLLESINQVHRAKNNVEHKRGGDMVAFAGAVSRLAESEAALSMQWRATRETMRAFRAAYRDFQLAESQVDK